MMSIKIRVGLIFALAAMLSLVAFLHAPRSHAASNAPKAKGRLFLVGMGSGDQDNMTVRAQKTLAKADVIMGMKYLLKKYPGLFKGKEVKVIEHALFMRMGPEQRGRRLKKRGLTERQFKAMEGETRNFIRQRVAEGKTVAVISGGDPVLYGPHVGYLREFADLDPEVVPGLSCFNAANAALGRGPNKGVKSHSVILTAAMGMHNWYTGKDTLAKLAETQSTMVFFTMHVDFPELVKQLKTSYPGHTPIAIVLHAGYRGKQKVIKATLDTIVERLKGKKLPFEHLIYVGDFLG